MSTPSSILRAGSGGIRKVTQESRWNTTGLNMGGDAKFYIKRNPKDVHIFRGLTGGTNATLTQRANDILIDADGSSFTSLGGDAGVFKQVVANQVQFRGLSGSTNDISVVQSITVTENVNDVSILGPLLIDARDNIQARVTSKPTMGASSYRNLILGYQAGQSHTDNSNDNILLGYRAGYSTTTASDVIAIGYTAGYQNSTASNTIAIGTETIASGAALTGTNNIVIGPSSGNQLDGPSNHNILLGYAPGYKLENTSSHNIMVGNQAGYWNLSAVDYNIYFGADAGQWNEGDYNVDIGFSAGNTTANASASKQVNIGWFAGWYLTTQSNVAMGYQALSYYADQSLHGIGIGYNAGATSAGGVTQANYGVFIGRNAGYDFTTATNNVYIGAQAGNGLAPNVTDRLRIQSGAGPTTLIDGDFSAATTDVSGVRGVASRIRLTEVATPANPQDGEGYLFEGDAALYWLPDSAGALVPLHLRGNGYANTESLTLVANDVTVTALDPDLGASIISVTDDAGAGSLAKATLGDGSTPGQIKCIACRNIDNAGVDSVEVKITNYLDATGSAGTKSLVFATAGLSAKLIWNGSYWMARDTGPATVGAPTF